LANLIFLPALGTSIASAPLIARDWHASRFEVVRKLITAMVLLITAMTGAGFLLLIGFGRWILTLFDPIYADAWGALIVLCLGQLVNAVCEPTKNLLTFADQEHSLLGITAAAGVVGLGLTAAGGALRRLDRCCHRRFAFHDPVERLDGPALYKAIERFPFEPRISVQARPDPEGNRGSSRQDARRRRRQSAFSGPGHARLTVTDPDAHEGRNLAAPAGFVSAIYPSGGGSYRFLIFAIFLSPMVIWVSVKKRPFGHCPFGFSPECDAVR